MDCIKTKLPVSFRLNSSYMNFSSIRRRFDDADFFNKNFNDPVEAGQTDEQAQPIDFTRDGLSKVAWFPNGVAYELNFTKGEIKRSAGLKNLQKFVNTCSDCGILTRQELVSMLPPLFLDIQESDLVLDMCAAPGSKTSQMLDNIFTQCKNKSPVYLRGAVIANDADNKRAFMLTHQLQRIDTSGMAVINHEGQHIPTLRKQGVPTGEDNRLFFDKVLADVPCSGDGAIRKIPLKWKCWNSRDGINIHSLQISILERSVQLTKVGGLVVYSTCSLNPIEDEAVLAEILFRANREAPGSLELVDIHDRLPGFVAHRGKSSWSVLVEKGEKRDKQDDSSKYTAEDLFHIWDKYDEESLKLNPHIRGNSL